MSKIKKHKKLKVKALQESKEKKLGVQNTNLKENTLAEHIKNAVVGLYYVSETDAEITLFIGKKSDAVTKEAVLTQIPNMTDQPIEERNFGGFFARLTEMQDWFGDEEKETTQKFVRLKEILEKNLRDLKVFKIGKIQLDVYVVGLDAENILTGIKTKAVET